MHTKTILETKNVRFRFKHTDAWFFENITLFFKQGTINFVRGNNGAGKSTLFRILQGIIEPYEEIQGSIVIDELDINLLAKNNIEILNQAVKIVQQKFDIMLADRFSFAENIAMAKCSMYPTLQKMPNFSLPDSLLKRFAINYQTPVYFLSGGQRQILAILMALQKPTKVLLLDEPTAALDATNATMVMEFLKELVEQTDLTVVIICHDKELVALYASQGYWDLRADPVSKVRSIYYCT